MSGAKPRCEIVERKGHFSVKILLEAGAFVVWATRDDQGRIKYDRPERVPRYLKLSVVPDLFREIDVRQFGISRATVGVGIGRRAPGVPVQ